MTTLIAIDPGAVSGAYALFRDDGIFVDDIPVVDGQLNAAALARIIIASEVTVAVVERVGAMPKQGVASTFKFGMAVGLIHGVLASLEVPMHLVTPVVWKKALGLRGPDGEASRALAIRLYPEVQGLVRKKDHNRADALLIGHWFKEKRP